MNGSTSRILSIDPGESTGIAFIEDGEFVWGMVAEAKSFDNEIFILSLTTMTKPTTIVLESPPTKTTFYNADQYRIYEQLLRFYQNAGFRTVTMNPGQWKKIMERTLVDSTHIRDAADMGKVQHFREMRSK